MPKVVEEIPPDLRPEVEAALAFVNAERGADFRVTGIVDPDDALRRRSTPGSFDLSLVLCQGDLCLNEQVRVLRDGEDIRCSLPAAAASNDDPPAHLDPPVGTRAGWLDGQLEKHVFVVLLFYRGFW
jgi:hypothetical protein